MKLSIIVPCYNESKNLPLILERFKDVIGDMAGIELILVDNGSTDDSALVLNGLLPGYSFARVERVNINQGYGFGILAGLKTARGEYLAWTHADMQTDPGDVIKAFDLAQKAGYPGKVFIKGERQKRPFKDLVFTWGMSFFETLFLGALLWDVNAQPNLFHRSFFELWKNPPYDFALDLYVFYMARKHKLDIVRFPVQFPKRIHGQSHWNIDWKSKWKFIKRTLDYSMKLKKNLKF